MNYVLSSKRRRQFILDGYLFNKRKTNNNNVVTWEYIERRNKRSCSVRVKTIDDRLLARLKDPHKDPPQPERLQAAKVRDDKMMTKRRQHKVMTY